MLQNIRNSARGWLAWVIVGIISVPFALWGIQEYMHPAPKKVIAEINGVELSESELQQEMARRQRELRQLREQEQQLRTMMQNQKSQQDPKIFNLWLYTARQIRARTSETKESVLAQLIEREVLVQSAIDANMRIGDALLVAHIHNDPSFQTEENTFSQERYEQILRYQGLTPTGFENKIRRALLTEQILKGVLDSALVTKYDQQQHTRLKEQRRSVSYLIIPTTRFDDSVTITEADIDNYYKDHAKRYMTPEKVSIEYVELSQKDVASEPIDEQTLENLYQKRKASFTTPAKWKARHILIEAGVGSTASEIEEAKKKAQNVLTKIQSGESFQKLAKQFSDDAISKEKGGELDEFMVKPFEDALKKLKVGEITNEPIKSKYGFHLIKLEDVKPEVVKSFAEVREQLENELQKEQTESKFENQALELADRAFIESLEILADTFNLEIKSTDLFDRTGSNQIDPILSDRKVIEAAFGEQVKEGYNSEVIEIGEQHVMVLRLKEHKPAKAKPLTEVKEEIVTTLKQEKTQAEARALGKSLLEQIKQNGEPDAFVKAHNLSFEPAQWIGRQDTTLKQPLIVREAFKMGRPIVNKALYQGIELGNGDYALVAVLAVKDGETVPEVPLTTAQKEDSETPDPSEQQVKQHQRALGESEFSQLISGLKTKIEIKKYSDKLSSEES